MTDGFIWSKELWVNLHVLQLCTNESHPVFVFIRHRMHSGKHFNCNKLMVIELKNKTYSICMWCKITTKTFSCILKQSLDALKKKKKLFWCLSSFVSSFINWQQKTPKTILIILRWQNLWIVFVVLKLNDTFMLSYFYVEWQSSKKDLSICVKQPKKVVGSIMLNVWFSNILLSLEHISNLIHFSQSLIMSLIILKI